MLVLQMFGDTPRTCGGSLRRPFRPRRGLTSGRADRLPRADTEDSPEDYPETPDAFAEGCSRGKRAGPFVTRHLVGSRPMRSSRRCVETWPPPPNDSHSSWALDGMNGDTRTAIRASCLTSDASACSSVSRVFGSFASDHGCVFCAYSFARVTLFHSTRSASCGRYPRLPSSAATCSLRSSASARSVSFGAPAGTTPLQYFSTLVTTRLARFPSAFARSALY